MAETHELRLKINAAAAKAGSREFVTAIEQIKQAVMSLDRMSDGTFKKLSKNARESAKAAQVKIKPVDQATIRTLADFAKLQEQAIRKTATARRGLTGLTDGLRTVSTGYSTARQMNEAYAQSVARANTALMRQAQLARDAATAARTPRATTGGPTGAPRLDTRAGDQQVAMQNRIKRAVDNTRVSVERLTVQLMKVGGFDQIQKLGSAFRDFERNMSRAGVGARELDTAKTKLNATMRQAQSAAVTLNARLQEEARVTKAAADAARMKERANKQAAASASSAAAAERARNAALERSERLSLSSAAATRRAAEEVARLSARLSQVGNTRGIAQLNTALNEFRAAASRGFASTVQLQQAQSRFAETTSRLKVSLTQAASEQQRAAKTARELAESENRAATSAGRLSNQMRAVGSSATTMNGQIRGATQNMRGLENAFSATFQVGSVFRTMLGTITFGTFAREVFNAGAALQQFRVTMEVATGSMRGASEQMDFIDGMARTLGTGLRTARDDFSKFAISAQLAGVETETARDIFRSVSQAMAVMGRGAEDQRLAFLALEQMLSKNTVSSEELRRQLGERLPGAVNLMARAVGVTTQELQKMLKAGSLVSSEVLPKFAREVDRAFGPGLERALQRAPAALGRFRNEIEFFLSAVADSGFMDALAQGFNDLTRALQQPGARESARKLGEGLAKLATTAINVAETIIENIDRIGQVAKVVFAGLLIRQVLLIRAAFAGMATQAATSIGATIASMTALNAATTANTAVTATNTATRKAATASLLTMKAGQDVLLASTLRANGAMAASTGLFGRVIAGFTGLAGGAGAAAGALGLVGRAFSFLLGPVGIAVGTLALVAPMFIDMSSEADRMADEVDAALKRAGISFEEFHATAQRSSNLELNRITQDLQTLQDSLDGFARMNSGSLMGLDIALKAINGTIETTDRMGHRAQAAFIGLGQVLGTTEQELANLSDGSKAVITRMITMTQEAARTGTGFATLREQIQAAMRDQPGAAEILGNLDEFVARAAAAEAGISNLNFRLVELYGTSNERLLKDFADFSAELLGTSDGVQQVERELRRLREEAPGVASELDTIFDSFRTAFRDGLGEDVFRARVVGVFDETARGIQAAQALAEEARRTADDTARAFNEITSGALRDLSGAGLFNLSDLGGSFDFSELQATLDLFQQLSAETVTVNQVMAEMRFATPQAQEFSAALNEQVQAMATAEAGYNDIAAAVNRLDEQFRTVDASELASKIQEIADNANRTVAALEAYRDSLDESNTAGRDLIDTLIEQVQAKADDEAAAYAAEAANYAAAASAREAGAAGRDGADGIFSLVAAFRALAAAGSEAAGNISARVTRLNREIELRQMNFVDRAVGREADRIANDFSTALTQAGNEFRTQLSAAEESFGGAVPDGIVAEMRAAHNERIATIHGLRDEALAAARTLATTPLNNEGRPTSGRRGGGGGGRSQSQEARDAANAKKRLEEATRELDAATSTYLARLDEENLALGILASGMTRSEHAARTLAQAQLAGIELTAQQTREFIMQIEAAEQLNRALERMANDPVNDWVNSVPTWREAGQQIERDVFDSLSNTISEFIQTGKFDFEQLGEAILGTIADIVADKAVKELVTAFGGNTTGSGEGGFGLGGFLSNLFGNGGSMGDEPDPFAGGQLNGAETASQIQNALTTGGQQVADMIRNAMTGGAQQASANVRNAHTTGGQQAGAAVRSGHTTGGAVAQSQVQTGGTIAGTQMNTQIVAGGSTAATAMQTGIVTGSQTGGGIFSQLFGGLFGGGGGGGLGGIFGLLLGGIGLFEKGGMSTSPVARGAAPLSAFRHAPSYAMGTPNTSGIPAILHDNEAVVPLTGNRKIPVAFSDEFADGLNAGSNTVNQTFNIQTPDADSFRKSQKQIAAEAAGAGQAALRANG